ncbi:rab effector Noc2-like [Tropilaelaps mercedesae]|uniref:Rab effector Noc2-like n=1 Tax=Tropilaelaps mercedesae TaxID=418985 RepID=A0A1V9XZ86_9ACAR|nr:rab effector Noc2-like [Tropilaelaps mercedesae]
MDAIGSSRSFLPDDISEGTTRNRTMSILQQQNILFQKERGPWACPNDRELALRAKVRSGWSIKSDHVFGIPGPLTDKERSKILEVVQKADRVEQMEQERIVKLVTQMEKMKHCCVLGQGSGQCHMCGSPFRLLISNAQRCSVCSQGVCSKCGLNAIILQSGTMQRDVVWLCKICHETREVWKKTGAWFFKSLPSYALQAIERERRARLSAQHFSQSNPVQMIRYRERYKDHLEPSTPGMTPAESHIDIKRTVYVSDSDDSSDDSLGDSARCVVERESAGQPGIADNSTGHSLPARKYMATNVLQRTPFHSAVRERRGNMNFGSLAEQVITQDIESAGSGGQKRALHSTNSTGSSTSTGTNSESLSSGLAGPMSKSAMSIDSLAQALDSAAAFAGNGAEFQPASPNELQSSGRHKKHKSSIYKRIRKSLRNATIGHALSFNEKRCSQHSVGSAGNSKSVDARQDHHLAASGATPRRPSTTDDLKYSEL